MVEVDSTFIFDWAALSEIAGVFVGLLIKRNLTLQIVNGVARVAILMAKWRYRPHHYHFL